VNVRQRQPGRVVFSETRNYQTDPLDFSTHFNLTAIKQLNKFYCIPFAPVFYGFGALKKGEENGRKMG
jgi:hypothetical protein